jgi:hypothetical protein
LVTKLIQQSSREFGEREKTGPPVASRPDSAIELTDHAPVRT